MNTKTDEPTTEEIVMELRKMESAAQVVLDSGFGTREGEHDTVYRKRRDIAKNAADRLEQLQRENAALKAEVLQYRHETKLGADETTSVDESFMEEETK